MSNIVKTSTLVRSQIPEWIRDDPNKDYTAFVNFIEAYYQWMETSGKALDFSKNLPSYMDIDSTTSQFMEYFSNDFLQYFPEDILISKNKAIKLAKELYQSKGVPSAFKLLFKILYDSEFDVEYNKDYVFRASAGTWFSVKSVRLQTTDPDFLKINNYRIFGEISKSLAVVENSILAGDKTEVFISDMQRLFQSGETITVVDGDNIPVIINGKTLSATLVGQISQITIDPNNRGLKYSVGDPVVVYGGLNPNIKDPHGATGKVGSTTTGSIQNINVVNGGVGYIFPNTDIIITNGNGAEAVLASIDPDPIYSSTVTVSTDTIVFKQGIKIGANNFFFANVISANANTKIVDALSFTEIETHPISSVLLLNGGSSLSTVPPISAKSTYLGDNEVKEDLYRLGILGPILITDGGQGYQANDIIQFSGGSGYGANAQVLSVNATGAITSTEYIPSSGYKLGGMGYTRNGVPSVNVVSANNQASGASLYVSGVLGDGAVFSATVTSIGSIGSITLTDPGEDYIAEPAISLKVQDILVSNTDYSNLPQLGDIVYQGASLEASSYRANVASIELIQPDFEQKYSIYSLRVFDYNSEPVFNLPLKFAEKDISLVITSPYGIPVLGAYLGGPLERPLYLGYTGFGANGLKTYGNGKAKAKATFLNGLSVSRQEYLNSSGQPSSYSVLQSDKYNNFTYKVKVQKEISKYRSALLDLLHPTGTRVIGEYTMNSNGYLRMDMSQSTLIGKSLQSYTGYNGSSASMVADFNNPANNIVTLDNIPVGVDITQFIFVDQPNTPNTIIEISPVNGPNIKSEIINVDGANNTLTLATNTWLTYANVAFVSTSTDSSAINILKITKSYNYINDGNYSNTMYPLKDIIHSGDTVKIGSDTYTASFVDYANNVVYTTTNILANTSNSFISVNRTLSAQTNVMLYGRIGIEYVAELVTEDNKNLITEDGKIILVD